MARKIRHKLLPLSRRLTPAQKKRRAERIKKREIKDTAIVD